MDRIYRFQRHIYDITRKYFLFGRDELIEQLALQPGDRVCEIGCGTARNLIKIARRYPDARLYGIDASVEMLTTAEAALARSGMMSRVRIARASAETFDPGTCFEIDGGFERIVFSYSLSMIPPWRESLDQALTLLAPGGAIHVVDFGDQAEMPVWFRALLTRWLAAFHVEHRPGIRSWFAERAAEGYAVQEQTIGGRYAELFTLRREA